MLKQLLFGLLFLSASVLVLAQTNRARISVNESLTKIHIAGDAILPNLIIENPGSNTLARVRVELVDPIDMVRSSAETEVQLKPGTNHIRLELRGWKQKSEEWNDSIWYRLRYKVTVPPANSPAAVGILALSTKADGIFDMRVVTSQNALPGKPLRVRIYTQSVADLHPMPSVQVRAELESDDAENKLNRAGVTDARGYAQLEFNVPASWTDSATIKVIASKGQVVRETSEEVSFRALWRFFVSTDKPLYQPGQTVHIRTLLLDPNKHALAKMPVTFTIADEDDTVVYRANAETSRFGVARDEWDIPENLRLGNYAIKVTAGTDADSDYRQGYQSIRVSRYELPTFTVNVKTDRAYYLPGQNAAVTASADYLFGKPVTKGHVKLARESEHGWNFKEQRWDVDEAQKWEGDIGTEGKFVANIDLSKEQENIEEGGRYRDLEFAAYFTESSTRKTEQRRFYLRVTRAPIHIYVIETGNLAPGQMPLEFYISASYADGSPAQCELTIHQGSVTDDKPGALLRTTKTNKYGVARISGLNVPPLTPSGKNIPLGRLVVLARDRQGRTGHETQDLWDSSDGLVIQAQTNHALYRPNEPIELDLHANRSDASLLVDVLRDGRVIRSQSVRLHGGHAFLVVPYGLDFQGELTVVAYSPGESSDSYSMPIATRTVLYPHDPALKVTAKFDRTTYRPGEDAVLSLRVRNTDGNAVEAALGAVIFDQAVEERARTDAEFGHSQGYGFDGQFGNYWYEASQIGGLKRLDLDRVDSSEPFSDDLQLAAEVLLLNRSGDRPAVFGGANYPAGAFQVFRGRFDSELAPMKMALNDAYAKDYTYPHTPDSLKQILNAKRVDFDSVLDPWGSPFHAKFSFNRSQEIMDVVSSGPDKKPGTEDDITVMMIQRPYFQKTGTTIDKAMEDYHSRTGAFVRDVATLKTELAKYGVDWDSLRDPWVRGYEARFGIANTRYTLAIMSAGPNGRFENDPTSDDFPVWTEYSEYFVDTAVKIDSALAKHFAATHSFPQTEAQFYQVLDEAKIPRSDLQDAWGHALQPVFDNQTRYQDRIVIDYSELATGNQLRSQKVEPETRQYAFIHLYSAGLDRILHTSDDFELATFSREIARQNSTMAQPNANTTAAPLSGGSGGITGVVIDPTGAVVARTKIAVELNGKISFSAETDENGRYTLRNLPTGFYTVTATATGFRSSVVTRVPVKSLNMTEVNLTLNVGAATEMVTVEASAPLVQTESASLASVVSHPGTAGPISTPRLREFFPETLLWEPMLETDGHGNSRVRFKFADSITDWKLSLIASTVDGQIGLLDTDVKTFQPFFVEHEPPQVLTQGDEISLPVVLRNYLEKSQTLHVEMKAEPWFSFLGPSSQETSVAAGESEAASFKFRVAAGLGEVKQRVTAANHETGDATEKSVRIHPDGEPLTVTAARLFSGKGDLDITVPDYAIPGSVQAEIKVYPNLMSHVVESTRSLLERPYGCGEQTISSTYPNLMVLRLYKQAGKAPDSIYRTALRYVGLGYARLLSYQHDDGGFSVWKQDKPGVPLTAYALRFLNDAREFITVDTAVVVSAQQWLLHQQAANGSWNNSLSETAYVMLSLHPSFNAKTSDVSDGKNIAPVTPALSAAAEFLQTRWGATADPYDLAQIALAAFSAVNKNLGAKVNAKLRSLIHQQGDSTYWAIETNTLFYEWGGAGRAETTALAIEALVQESASDPNPDVTAQDRSLAEQGLIFLIHEKDGYGAWYSGQTTVNVLEAFLLLGKARSDAPPASAEVDVNGEKAADLKLPSPNEIAAPFEVDITKFIKPGHNQISIKSPGDSQAASAQAVTRYYIPWERSSAHNVSNLRTGDSDALALRVSYDQTGLRPGSDIHCRVHAERIGFRGYGMLLAEIGLPPGAVPDRSSLERAMNDADWNISQYEIRPDRLVVYLWPKAGGTDFDFTFRERYEVNALTAPSVLYDYYNPDAQTVVRPTRIDVKETRVASR